MTIRTVRGQASNLRRRFVATCLGSTLLCAAAASAQSVPTVLFSNLSSDPSSSVPLPMGADPLSFTNFVRPYVSPNGQHWAMVAGNPGSASRNILLVGSVPGIGLGGGGHAGAAASTRTVIVAGQAVPMTAGWLPGETFETFKRNISINNAGQLAFSTNTSNLTSADEVLVRMEPLMTGVDPTFTVLAREGDGAFGLTGDGVTFGSSIDSVTLQQDGTVSFYSSLGGTVSSADNTAIWFGQTLVARKGVTAPPGQFDDPPAVLTELRDTRYYRSPDGGSWVEGITLGTDTSRDRAVMVNGTVVAQEGTILAGSGFDFPVGTNASGLGEINMGMDGAWFLRGLNPDISQYWVARNGDPIAVVGDPVTPCASEFWSIRTFTPAVFYTNIANGAGDYVVGGATDILDENFSGVLVLNGQSIVLRSNDPVDLDGDGVVESNVFIRNFFFDDTALTNDLKLFVVVGLKDEFDVQIGKALLIKQLVRPCTADQTGDGTVDLADLVSFLSDWTPNIGLTGQCVAGDLNGDEVVDLADLVLFLTEWTPLIGGDCTPV